MSQTLSTWENYLVVFVCPRIYLGIYLAIYHDRKNNSKNHGLLEFALGSSFGGGLDEKFGRP